MDTVSTTTLLAPVFEALQASKVKQASGTATVPTMDETATLHPQDLAPTPSLPSLRDADVFSMDDAFDEVDNDHSSLTEPQDQDFLVIAQSLVKQGQWEKAERYYQIILLSFPDSPAIRVEAAQVYQHQGKTAEALSVLAPWHQQAPDSVEALQAMGQALCADKQFDKCERLLLDALTRGISSVKLYYWLGESLRQQGKLRAAQTTYLLALRLSPQDMMLRLALITLVSESDTSQERTAKIYYQAMDACLKGDVDESVKFIQEALMLSSVSGQPSTDGKNTPVLDESLEQIISAVKLSGDAGPELSEFLNQSNAMSPEKIIIRAKIKIEEGAQEVAYSMLNQGMVDFPDSALLVSTYAHLLEQKSLQDVIDFLEPKLKIFNMDFTVWAIYGRALLLLENYHKALDALRKAYQINANDFDNNNNLVMVCRRTDNLSFALEIVQKNIALRGETPDNLLLLGTLHADMGSLGEAGTYFSMVIKKDPQDLRGLMAQALLYKKNRMSRDAILVLRAHIANPIALANVDFLYLYTALLREDEQYTDARQYLQKLLDLSPKHQAGRRLMAEILVIQGHYPEAAQHFRELLKTQRHDVKCLADLAEVYELCGELSDAQDLYKEALEKKPNYPKAKQNLGFCRLRQEDFAQGLEAYEVMSATSSSGFAEVGEIPFWRGESIKGKSLLLYQNCSTSETILFARYFPYLQKMGARLHLLVQSDLVQLLIPNSDICSDQPQVADFTLPISSLPKIFSINLSRIPSPQQYLASDFSLMDRWDRLLGTKKTKPLVGIAWQSELPLEKRKPYDKVSSMDLTLFGELVGKKKYDFISFQRGFDGQRQENACSYPIRSSSGLVTNWADIAAGILKMDMVITNDQPVAHIAGALGIKTLVLLPYVAPWYWFSNREDSPWYSSVKIIRQSVVRDWFSTIRKVEEALTHLPSVNK